MDSTPNIVVKVWTDQKLRTVIIYCQISTSCILCRTAWHSCTNQSSKICIFCRCRINTFCIRKRAVTCKTIPFVLHKKAAPFSHGAAEDQSNMTFSWWILPYRSISSCQHFRSPSSSAEVPDAFPSWFPKFPHRNTARQTPIQDWTWCILHNEPFEHQGWQADQPCLMTLGSMLQPGVSSLADAHRQARFW